VDEIATDQCCVCTLSHRRPISLHPSTLVGNACTCDNSTDDIYHELLSGQAAPAHRSTILIMTRTAPRYSHKILIKPIVGSRSGGVHADVYLPARPASAPIGEFALLRIPDAGMLLMDVCCLQRSVSTVVDSPWGKARTYRPTRWSGYWRTGTLSYRSNIDSLLSMCTFSPVTLGCWG
jgi:hypothetical protein